MSSDELLAVGRIARAHGIRGELSVQPLSEVESRFTPGAVLLLGPEGDRRLTVTASRPHQGRLLVSFEEIGDRTAAEALRGRLLLAVAGTSPAPPEGGFWVHQVAGLEVFAEDGRRLGRVREVLHTAANDVWAVQDGDRELLIPALRDVVIAVDLDQGRVTVRELPGLMED